MKPKPPVRSKKLHPKSATLKVTETPLGFDAEVDGDEDSTAWALVNWLWDEKAKEWEEKETLQ